MSFVRMTVSELSGGYQERNINVSQVKYHYWDAYYGHLMVFSDGTKLISRDDPAPLLTAYGESREKSGNKP